MTVVLKPREVGPAIEVVLSSAHAGQVWLLPMLPPGRGGGGWVVGSELVAALQMIRTFQITTREEAAQDDRQAEWQAETEFLRAQRYPGEIAPG